jgi:hypothetical protein
MLLYANEDIISTPSIVNSGNILFANLKTLGSSVKFLLKPSEKNTKI